MSRDDRLQNCDAFRERAFEYRKGEISGRDRDRLREHLEGCESCRDYLDRLDILIETTRETEPAPGPSDPDAMFDRITDEIERREAPDALESGTVDRDDPEDDEAAEEIDVAVEPGWSRYVGVAAAALIAGLILGGILTRFLAAGGGEPGASRADRSEKTPAAGGRSGDSSGEDRGFADLRRVESSEGAGEADEALEIYASDGAKWSVDEDRGTTVHLEQGRLLVEYVPGDGESLRVEAAGDSIRVVGTVFFVSADKRGPRAGVLAGRVEVESDSGDSVRLEAGQEVSAEFERSEMPESRRESLEQYVDLEQHRRRLGEADRTGGSAARGASAGGGTPDDERSGVARAAGAKTAPAADAEDSPLRRLRRRADRAAARGELDRAADLYESFLSRSSRSHPGRGPVRLDLANLYIHRLGTPERAIDHLETYLRRWPDGVAAPSVRDELCRVTRRVDGHRPQCEGATE